MAVLLASGTMRLLASTFDFATYGSVRSQNLNGGDMPTSAIFASNVNLSVPSRPLAGVLRTANCIDDLLVPTNLHSLRNFHIYIIILSIVSIVSFPLSGFLRVSGSATPAELARAPRDRIRGFIRSRIV
jgi:hypothetical protein